MLYAIIAYPAQGMVPSSLSSILSQWQPGPEGEQARPKFLYINPTGANPTGTLLPEQRRREIYQLCCKVETPVPAPDPDPTPLPVLPPTPHSTTCYCWKTTPTTTSSSQTLPPDLPAFLVWTLRAGSSGQKLKKTAPQTVHTQV